MSTTLQEPTQILYEIEQIKQTKARYFRFLDTQQWTQWRTCFTDDMQFVLEQEVVILIDRPHESVFNRHQTVRRFAAGDALKRCGKGLAGQNSRAAAEQLSHSFFAERAPFALQGDYRDCHIVEFSFSILDFRFST